MTDRLGNPLREGDIVLAFEQSYKEVRRGQIDDTTVVFVDKETPLPVPDVPLFRGRVTWNPRSGSHKVTIMEVLIPDDDPRNNRPGIELVFELEKPSEPQPQPWTPPKK